MDLQQYVGRFARSIESGWLGKIVGVESHRGDAMLRMQGVNELCMVIAGGDIESHIDADDTQWFAPEDLRFVNVTPLVAPVVHRYDDKTPGAWEAFMNAMHSGEQFECDGEMYYYWLEVLPPKYFKGPVIWPDGFTIRPAFGFVEGADYICAFWMTGKEKLVERPEGGVVCTLHRQGEPGARYFGRITNIMNRG